MNEAALCQVNWWQPKGQWPLRGACAGALGIGLGGPNIMWPPLGWADQENHTLWHYWACSPSPGDLWAAMNQHVDPAQRDQLNVHGAHPWHWLALHGYGEAMQAWKDAWPVPPLGTWGGDTLAHCAAWSGDSLTIDVALAETTSLDALDATGTPALIVSVYRGSDEQVVALMAAGADPDIRDPQGRSALHHAALLGNASLLGELDDAGGNMDLPDREGDTPASILDDRMEMSAGQVAALRMHWAKRYQRKLRL